MSKQENKQVSRKEQFEKFKGESTKARHEAMTYVDLAKGEKMTVQVLLERGAKIEEIKSEKGDFKKVCYRVLNLEAGQELDLRLTPRQSAKLEDEIEKLILRDFDPVVRLKKIDDKTLDIEGLAPNANK
jgi:citrate synthase